MADVIVYGFPVSTYVNIVRLILTEKGAPFHFHDLEPEMGGPSHLALHPFSRVPILEHDGFRLYETSAIGIYIDEAFGGPSLQPTDVRERANMHRWISLLNAYFYPYMAYHLGHERIVFPALGIEPDEKVVAAALPKIATCLAVMDAELEANGDYLVGETGGASGGAASRGTDCRASGPANRRSCPARSWAEAAPKRAGGEPQGAVARQRGLRGGCKEPARPQALLGETRRRATAGAKRPKGRTRRSRVSGATEHARRPLSDGSGATSIPFVYVRESTGSELDQSAPDGGHYCLDAGADTQLQAHA